MKKYLSGILMLACVVSLAACGGRTEQGNGAAPKSADLPKDQFAVDIVCKDKDISQISYTAYVNGEHRTTGGQVILDKNKGAEGVFTLSFSSDDFEAGDDMSEFSITLSPIRNGEDVGANVTEPVAVPVEYGKTYTVALSGEGGDYAAELLEV